MKKRLIDFGLILFFSGLVLGLIASSDEGFTGKSVFVGIVIIILFACNVFQALGTFKNEKDQEKTHS